MKPYIFFRYLAILSLLLVVAVCTLYYVELIEVKWFTVLSPILAVLATIFAAMMGRPGDPQDVSVAVGKVLMHYDVQTLAQLKDAKEQEKEIRIFIDFKSNEIFYTRLREHLKEELERKYRGSEVEALIDELSNVEAELDKLNFNYDEAELPDRFRDFLTTLEKKKVVNLLMEMVDAFPFLPFKKLLKYYLKLRYLGYGQLTVPKPVKKPPNQGKDN